jgi:hypothetical protein
MVYRKRKERYYGSNRKYAVRGEERGKLKIRKRERNRLQFLARLPEDNYKVVKAKGFPLQAYSGSWGSRRLRLPYLLDFRHYEGGKVVTLTHRPSSPPGVFLVLIFRG